MHTIQNNPSLFRAVFVRFGAMFATVVLIAIWQGAT